MTRPTATASKEAWDMIDKEKQRDRLIRRVSVTAWTVTFVIVLIFTVLTGISVAEMMKGAMAGALPWITVLGSAVPLFTTLLMLSVLIATLSTVGIFLRLRTASLSEIQLRLAALEDMLATRPDSTN
jgi:hypothetical protein